MSIDFMFYSKDNAPTPSRDLLKSVENKFEWVPNVLKQIALSPVALAATLQLMESLEKTSLSLQEQWICLLTVAYQNSSPYCVAANSTIARMMQVPLDIIQGLRGGDPLQDPRYEALRSLIREMIEHRGGVSEKALKQFFQAGFSKEQFFEVVIAIALETIASFTARALATPTDEQYRENSWAPVASSQ